MSHDRGNGSAEPAIAVERLTTVGASGPRGGWLAGVSFEVMVGELTVLSGLPEAGPTTVLQVLAGHGPAVTGRVRARGRTFDLGSEQSDGVALIGLTSRTEVLRSSTVGLALRRDVEPARAAAALQLLKITGLRTRDPHHLSPLQLMLVAIGRELTDNPAVLAADHPTGGLTLQETRVLVARLRDVVDLEGRTVLVSSRDPVLAADADHVIGFEVGAVCDDRRLDVPDEEDEHRHARPLLKSKRS